MNQREPFSVWVFWLSIATINATKQRVCLYDNSICRPTTVSRRQRNLKLWLTAAKNELNHFNGWSMKLLKYYELWWLKFAFFAWCARIFGFCVALFCVLSRAAPPVVFLWHHAELQLQNEVERVWSDVLLHIKRFFFRSFLKAYNEFCNFYLSKKLAGYHRLIRSKLELSEEKFEKQRSDGGNKKCKLVIRILIACGKSLC